MTFDPAGATQAYLDTLDPEALAMARDYTTGNHLLILGGLAVSALVTWLIVRSHVLDKLALRMEKRSTALRTFAIGAVYLLISALLTLPWNIYTGWWREIQFDRTSQPFGDFLSQGAVEVVLVAIIGAIFLTGVYGLIRRTGKNWWIWSGGLVAGALAFFLLLSPMLIEPLFNDYEPIPEGEVRDAVLALGADAGVPEGRVFMFDGSRQSNNFTANVSGVGSNARIAISDVAISEASLDEVKAVTGHEIGHYALGHVWRAIAVYALIAIALFWLTARTYPFFARVFRSTATLEEVRGVPVFVFVAGLYIVLAQPAMNAVVRAGEREADIYSLETVGLPDALAGALIKTAEYRYPRASALEEALFYTHPTIEDRIRAAMEWKAEQEGAAE
ncbi:M48 family metallopeptidase [Aurantiacibacter marinus]|uniref:Peptidase M48 n=1 Tax=Aurantiacibacter marinus TaxID=874156 RepID=A0A0H0XR94_9SPHN|nr:M48 family metallopeptidase [Aurantiacibacter marinus]KLI64462.1 peptidase M48 [Aurantiacibacter marinus]